MRFMYVGPSITGVATRNTTHDEMPDSLAAGIEEGSLQELGTAFQKVLDGMKGGSP